MIDDVKGLCPMRRFSVASVLTLVFLMTGSLARADIQGAGTSTAPSLGSTSLNAPTVASVTSHTTVNSDGSVTVTTTTTDANGNQTTTTTTTYPHTADNGWNRSGSSGGGQGSSGGGLGNMGQIIIPALMNGVMGNSGGLMGSMGNMGTMGGAPVYSPGSSGNIGAGQASPGTTDATHTASTDGKDKDTKAKDKKNEACKDPKAAKDKAAEDDGFGGHPGKAKDDYVGGSTGSQTADNPGKAKDDQVAQTNPCEKPKYETPAPTGTGKIKTMADAQAIVDAGQCVTSSGSSDENNASCQCVSLTKGVSGLGPSSTWQKGEQVKGNMNIPIGTPIATFNGNDGTTFGTAANPGGVSGFSHTGIYLGQNDTGVIMLHQYTRSGGPIITTIPWDTWSGGTNEAGSKYFVVASPTSFLEMLWPGSSRALAETLLNGHTVWYLVQG